MKHHSRSTCPYPQPKSISPCLRRPREQYTHTPTHTRKAYKLFNCISTYDLQTNHDNLAFFERGKQKKKRRDGAGFDSWEEKNHVTIISVWRGLFLDGVFLGRWAFSSSSILSSCLFMDMDGGVIGRSGGEKKGPQKRGWVDGGKPNDNMNMGKPEQSKVRSNLSRMILV